MSTIKTPIFDGQPNEPGDVIGIYDADGNGINATRLVEFVNRVGALEAKLREIWHEFDQVHDGEPQTKMPSVLLASINDLLSKDARSAPLAVVKS